MNRAPVQTVGSGMRGIVPDSAQYKEQVAKWTSRILAHEPCTPDGHIFLWTRGPDSASNSAYLYDATMCNVQYAQNQLQRAATTVGKQSYKACIDAAQTYAFVITELLPRWTFRPRELYRLPDTMDHDIYGHYCLARAMAYHSVGRADLTCTRPARIAAAGNAAHLYMVAAQLICGDTTEMINRAVECTADALVQSSDTYLDAWEEDKDPNGAAKALACIQEADKRYNSVGATGCSEKVIYAYARNQVHWLPPELPEWNTLVRARITRC